MNYLLDTHIILWLAENSSSLSRTAKTILLDEQTNKFASVASCWEVAIKLRLDKLELVGGMKEFYRILEENGIMILQITAEQLTVLESLPFHHRDPFDRLLVSAALAEELILLTADAQIRAYNTEGLRTAS